MASMFAKIKTGAANVKAQTAITLSKMTPAEIEASKKATAALQASRPKPKTGILGKANKAINKGFDAVQAVDPGIMTWATVPAQAVYQGAVAGDYKVAVKTLKEDVANEVAFVKGVGTGNYSAGAKAKLGKAASNMGLTAQLDKAIGAYDKAGAIATKGQKALEAGKALQEGGVDGLIQTGQAKAYDTIKSAENTLSSGINPFNESMMKSVLTQTSQSVGALVGLDAARMASGKPVNDALERSASNAEKKPSEYPSSPKTLAQLIAELINKILGTEF